MFKFFNKENKSQNRDLVCVQNQNKENLEDFILVLEQIQETNNEIKTSRCSSFKNYKMKQQLINNIVALAIEKTEEKIKELG